MSNKVAFQQIIHRSSRPTRSHEHLPRRRLNGMMAQFMKASQIMFLLAVVFQQAFGGP